MESVIDTTPAPAAVAPRQLSIEFTGSGSEYFRIWIVNLLLILVTLGLYLPFAKARRIRYFYANTRIDGQALSFHGNPWKMFRGFVLLVVLMGAYGIAERFSPLAALMAFIALCVAWPALWRASMQFCLANTSWRGLRMAFEGRLQDAYQAVAPLYVPLIAFVGLSLFAQQPPSGGGDATAAASAAVATDGLLLLAAMAVAALSTPWFLTLTKRYQHNGFRIARQRTQVDLPVSRMYGLSVKGGLIGMLPVVLVGVVAAVIVAAVSALQSEAGKAWATLLVGAAVLLAYLIWFVIVVPYFTARMQNLVWSATRSQAVKFTSQLPFRTLFWLTLKNWSLVVLTLSLYRPFAVVHTARLRLESVSLAVTEDVAQWSAGTRAGMQDATGDIAGDFFGIDLGL